MQQTEIAGPVALALAALHSIPECSGHTAVLLFGSHARGGACTSSDVDLLVIGPVIDRLYKEHPGFSLDLICETRESVLEKLKKHDHWNNHFLLNILTDAVLLSDTAGIGVGLIDTARTRRERGPQALTAIEAKQAGRAIAIMLRSAKAEPERIGAYTQEGRALCRMRLDQIVSRSIYLNFKARRRWSSSFPHAVAWIGQSEPELYRLWLQYAHTPLEGARDAAAEIVQFTLQCLLEAGGVSE